MFQYLRDSVHERNDSMSDFVLYLLMCCVQGVSRTMELHRPSGRPLAMREFDSAIFPRSLSQYSQDLIVHDQSSSIPPALISPHRLCQISPPASQTKHRPPTAVSLSFAFCKCTCPMLAPPGCTGTKPVFRSGEVATEGMTRVLENLPSLKTAASHGLFVAMSPPPCI